LGFLFLILSGSFLLNLPIASRDGVPVGFVNALFTATSAVCVTGLVAVDTYSEFTVFGQVTVMLLIQMGGLGIMTMATLIFLLLGKKITLKERLIMQEALNQDTISGIVKLSRHILSITLVFEATGALLLSISFLKTYGLPKGIYYGIFHSVSAFNNAGFDLIGDYRNLTPFAEDPLINIVIMGLIVFGGLGFTVIQDMMAHRSFRKPSLHSKVVLTVTGILLSAGFLAFMLLERGNPGTLKDLSPSGKVFAAAFQSVTARTAGFNTIDLLKMTRSSQFLMLLLMFIGASPASTGGGIKTTTFASVTLMIYSVISLKTDVEVFERRIPREVIFKSVAIVVISTLLVFSVTFLLTITENAEVFPLLFEAISAFGTVGLTLGVTQNLTNAGKLLISLTMFAGRVGPLTLVLALNNRNKKSPMKFPEEHLLVG